jgi:hypothetical protein
MYLQIGFWIIIGYIVSIIVGRILTYTSAILHNWCMLIIWDHQYWYNKGTTIKDIYNKISYGDNFRSSNEGKFYPIGNILFPLIWLLGELAFFTLIILIIFIRLVIFICIILHKIIYVKCLSKILKPIYKCLSNINWQNTWIIKFIKSIITILNNIKKSFLNLRIA